MKIAVVLGTRPEIIKTSMIIKEIEKRGIDYFIIHTGQHYSYKMDWKFFEELSLPEPKYNLGIRSKSPSHQGDHTGRMMISIEEDILKERPDIVLVQGDTNSVLAASLCTSKLKTAGMKMTLGHIEAGLRSFDRSMPEEINRVVSDSLSDILFAPTENSKKNLLNEDVKEENIYVTGNTVVDAIEFFKNRITNNILNEVGLRKNEYFLVTAHRQDNVDVKERFTSMLEGIRRVCKEFGIVAVYPIHPRSKKMIESFGIKIPEEIRTIDPVGYLDFLSLQKNSRMIFTDSGGIQEEACVLGIPCITLRDNTERQETVEVKSNIIAGIDPEKIVDSAKIMMNSDKNWSNPFGDGKTSQKILDILER